MKPKTITELAALVGRDVHVQAAGLVARVHVVNVSTAYGNFRLQVVQPGHGTSATWIDAGRIVDAPADRPGSPNWIFAQTDAGRRAERGGA